MRLGIVGSRQFPRPDLVVSLIDVLRYDTVVVSGTEPVLWKRNQDGERVPATLEDQGNHVDRVAVFRAREQRLETKVHRAEWDRYGRSAGPRRNRKIVADTHALVAYWDGSSPGTTDCITAAHKRGSGLPLAVIQPHDAAAHRWKLTMTGVGPGMAFAGLFEFLCRMVAEG